MEDTVSIIEGVIDECLKGNWDVEIDLEKIDEQHKNVCKKLNSILKFQKKSMKLSFESASDVKRMFLEIGRLCSRLMKGDLSQRINISPLPSDMRPMGINLNRVFDRLQENIEELQRREANLKNAVSVFGEALSKAAGGDLSARVSLEGIGAGYLPIGEDINKMISAMGANIDELREREDALKSAISSFGSVLSSAASGNLKAKVDLSKISEEYKPIGEDINSMISAIEEDISELKKREREVREARLYAEAIIANISDPLWVVDKEDRWILVNDAMKKLTGYSDREILEKQTSKQPLFEFFLGVPGGEERLKVMSDGMKSMTHVTEIIPWVTKDNKFLIVSCSGEPLKDSNGNVIGGVFAGKEMSTQQRAGTETTKALAKKTETMIGKDYELATLLFMTNAAMLAGDSSIDILKATVEGYNGRFNKNVKIKDGLTLRNMKKEDLPSFVEFLLETFYQCIGPTTFECSEGIESINPIVEKVKARYSL